MEKHFIKKIVEKGYSIIPVNDDKTPKGSWKRNQEIPYSIDEIDSIYSNTWAIITGFNNLEIIDFDLKVLSTL